MDPHFRDEQEMIYNISDIVEEKCEEGKFPH